MLIADTHEVGRLVGYRVQSTSGALMAVIVRYALAGIGMPSQLWVI